jgi:hypothetical protein
LTPPAFDLPKAEEHAGWLLANGRSVEAIRAADEIRHHARRSWPAQQVLVEALARNGEFARLTALLMSGDEKRREGRRRKLLVCALRGAAFRGFADAVALARALRTRLPKLELLIALSGSARSFPNRRELRALAREWCTREERTILHCWLDLQEHALERAQAHLDKVPRQAADRPTLVKRLIGLARLHDRPDLVHSLAGFHRIEPDSLSMVRRLAVASGECGDFGAALSGFSHLRSMMTEIRGDEELFRQHWRQLVSLSFDFFDVAAGLADISAAQAAGWAMEPDLVSDTAYRFLDEFQRELDGSKGVMDDLLANRPIRWPEGEAVRLVVPRMKLMVGSQHLLPAQESWLRVLGTTMREARASGAGSSIVLECLAPLLAERKPAAVELSYHTHGIRPNRMHFKEADIQRYVLLDPAGYSGWSSVADWSLDRWRVDEVDEEVAARFHAAHWAEVVEANHSKYEQPGKEDFVPVIGPYVFMALQIPTDRVQQLADIDMLEMIGIVARRFAGSGISVIVKRHPYDEDLRTELMLERHLRQGTILLRNDSIHALIAGAQAVITVNSGVGCEALAQLKPVYLFGRADYGAACHQVRSAADFVRMTSPITLPASPNRIRKFLYLYRTRYLADSENPADLSQKIRDRIIEAARYRLAAETRSA